MSTERIHVAISFDGFCDLLLDKVSSRTGITRSEIIRRLLVAYAAGKDATTVLPKLAEVPMGATAAWKEMAT